jgi:hypothetical protein
VGTFLAITVHPAPSASEPWIPPIKRTGALKRDALNESLVHQYLADAHTLEESDWVYLHAVVYAEQIHPWTIDQVDALGPIEGRNAARCSRRASRGTASSA